MTDHVLCLAGRDTDAFGRERLGVDVVCAGDSLTGWNNYGPADCWPQPVYPQFLQELCRPLGLRIANAGVAGEISRNGVKQVRECLELFPHARCFIMGYGTNDLAMWSDLERTSGEIIANIGQMVESVRERGKRPIVFNVPYANEPLFPPRLASQLHAEREFHNARLKEYCNLHGVPLANVCSRLCPEHLADELHTNEPGARIIAEEVFKHIDGAPAELD